MGIIEDEKRFGVNCAQFGRHPRACISFPAALCLVETTRKQADK